MILFQNRLILLDYDPGSDVLSVEWPSFAPYDLPEVEQSLNILVDHIRNYDVKRLLIDSSMSKTSPELDMATYQRIVAEFARKLTTTRLQKSARIMHADLSREAAAQRISEDTTGKAEVSIESRTFTSRTAAWPWLTA